jgi:Transposase
LFKACTVTEGDHQVAVMIGIDPHKGSHTASAIDAAEIALGEVRVRANDFQLERLLGWAEKWPQRTWAVENSGGLGYLLAQQLLAAGQTVLDVPPKLAAGCGCSTLGTRTRMIPTTPAQWPSRRHGHRRCGPSRSRIIRP